MATLIMTLSTLLAAGPSPDVVARFEAGQVAAADGSAALKYRLLKPPSIEAGASYPLVIFLHGAGERGDDNTLQLLYLPTWMSEPSYLEKFPCFLLAPQCPSGKWWAPLRLRAPDKDSSQQPNETPDATDEARRKAAMSQLVAVERMIENALAELPVDRSRVYLTGLSMGGFGSWALAARHPDWFAAVLPICGGGDAKQAAALAGVPLWVAHGDADPVVPVRLSREMVEAVRAAGGQVEYRELPGVGHDSWTPVYRDSDEALRWLFNQRRAATK